MNATAPVAENVSVIVVVDEPRVVVVVSSTYVIIVSEIVSCAAVSAVVAGVVIGVVVGTVDMVVSDIDGFELSVSAARKTPAIVYVLVEFANGIIEPAVSSADEVVVVVTVVLVSAASTTAVFETVTILVLFNVTITV